MRPNESFVAQPVRSLQTMLRVLSEDDDTLLSLIPDGIYGAQTHQAVSQFQRKYGIAATGMVDQPTWERVVAEYRPALVRLGPAEPLQLILNPNQVLRKGQEHPYLFLIQGMLVALSSALCYDKKTVVLSVLGTYFGGMVLDHFIFGLNIKRRVCIISPHLETIIDFVLNERIQASFIGEPDFHRNVFRLRGCIVMKNADYVPKTRELPFGSEDKSFEIEV